MLQCRAIYCVWVSEGFLVKRSVFEIIEEILASAKEKSLKTPIMYEVNLTHKQLEKYLEFLRGKSLLESRDYGGKTFYETTAKGFSFLASYYELKNLLTSNMEIYPKTYGNGVALNRVPLVKELKS